MFDIFPPFGTQMLLAVMCATAYFICSMLLIAAWRNHFWRHTTRPVVWAIALLMFSLGAEFLKRLTTSFITGPLRALFVGSGLIDDAVNTLLFVAMVAMFLTLVVAYPDAHRGNK